MANFPAIPQRLQLIDELTVGEHSHIALDDECFYLWERTTGGRYDQYPTNDFIKNLQIEVSCQGSYRWIHKIRAIQHAAIALAQLIPVDWRDSSTFIPIPPSLIKSDTGHDPRLLQVLHSIRPCLSNIRELVLQNENSVSKQKDISPQERARNYRIDQEQIFPIPAHIVIFDDMLAGGSHFKAMKMVLLQQYPDVQVSGLFLSRAIRLQPASATISIKWPGA